MVLVETIKFTNNTVYKYKLVLLSVRALHPEE